MISGFKRCLQGIIYVDKKKKKEKDRGQYGHTQAKKSPI